MPWPISRYHPPPVSDRSVGQSEQAFVQLDPGEHKAGRAIDRPVAALASIGERDHPLDVRIVLFDHPHRDRQAALAIARQGFRERQPVQLEETVPCGIAREPENVRLIHCRAKRHRAFKPAVQKDPSARKALLTVLWL